MMMPLKSSSRCCSKLGAGIRMSRMNIWEWSQLGTSRRFLTGLMEVFFHEAHFVKSKETRQREVLQSFDGAKRGKSRGGARSICLPPY